LIELTREALRQFDGLRAHYRKKRYIEALRNLRAAVVMAADTIERDLLVGLPAPPAYPEVARPGQSWVQVGSYWFRYSRTKPPVITGIFYVTADIPNRV
jgi:hypothetical protein